MNLKYLFLIILFGFALRAAFITDFPPSLNWDEVSLGYNAYSLLKTGRDEWGTVLPAIFRAFGDFKLPGYIYADVPFVAVLGLNALSVRFPSIMAGTLLIFLVYALSRKLSAPPLTSALLAAISPWSLFLSRVAVEANLGIFLFTLGVTLLLYRKLSLGIIYVLLSAWTYNSFRIFAPLFIVAYFLIYRTKTNIILYSLFFILFIPVLIQLLSPSGQARYKWLTLLDEGAIAQINQLRQRPGGRFVYNKATYLAYRFTTNYLNHFNPRFLFINGGSQYQFNIPGFGLLYLICLPFFYIGFLKIFKHKVILLWLILAPIAGSLTRDAPHTLRAITMLPAVILITAYGLNRCSQVLKNTRIIFILLLLLSLDYYLNPVAFNYRTNYSWSWQYGYKETVKYVMDNYSKYDEIIFTKRYAEPHEFIAFYWPWDPADFQKSKRWDYHADWYWVNRLEKIKFVNDWEMPIVIAALLPGQKYLVISSPDNPSPGTLLTQINFLDSKPAFYIKEL
ncbi:MAG: Uncharacterized protein G01um101416_107 [Microgenomates group bacterium Gr01-1014_16]|nr:MAG: Uncharacterized protein G01um101416_107 [Microgenomates group bacterium Gr01-1014_16]